MRLENEKGRFLDIAWRAYPIKTKKINSSQAVYNSNSDAYAKVLIEFEGQLTGY